MEPEIILMLFVYRLKDVLVDSANPKIEDNWEYVSLPDTVEVYQNG